jgi:GNAT superfamily N-acetyltransferase
VNASAGNRVGAAEPSSGVPTAHELARFSLARQHPLSRTWLDDERRLAALAEEHAFDVQLSTDLELARTRARQLGLDLPPEALLNRWLPVSDGLEALLSIRFEGGDVELPFVDVTVASRPVTAGDRGALAAAAEQAFPGFGSRRLRFWDPGAIGAVPGTTPDLRVLAAPLAGLRRGHVPDSLRLSPTLDDRHLEDARAAYAAVQSRHPDHSRQARVLDAESLAQTIATGSMFDVWWQGEWSGYVGTLPESQLGLPAHVIQELVLTPPARGRGLGRYLSTLLARALPDDGRVLSGTIHGNNVGARRAALEAGRVDLGGWSWWTYAG